MKTFKLPNARTQFFTDKEHYLKFRDAWASAVNHPDAKSTLKTYSWGVVRDKGSVQGAENLVYALLRGKDIFKAFTPITNYNKLTKSMDRPYKGLYDARSVLNGTIWGVSLNLEAFNGTVTEEMINELKETLPRFEDIT